MWRMIITLAMGFLSQAAFANLVVNGDFETGNATGWEVSQYESETSVTSIDLFGDGESFVFDSWGGQDGTAKANQCVDLTAGDIFTVSWDQAFFNDGPTTIQSGVYEFEVRITGNGRISLWSQGVLAADEVASLHEDKTFVAEVSDQAELAFHMRRTGCCPSESVVHAFLDNIVFVHNPLGDVNLDGDVNGLDVDSFVDSLLAGLFSYPADMNRDGAVTGLDVDSFVAAVVSGNVQSIPEPSALLLALVALAAVGGWRKWGG